MTFDSGRRSSFKKMLLGGAAMGTLSSMEFKEKETYALKGNINHGVCAWSMRPLSLEELCAQIKSVGVGAIDLISPANWELLKKYDIHCSMCNGAEISLEKGFADRRFHDELVARYMRHIDLVADAGYRNLICFSGNRNGMDPQQGLANAEAGLKRILGHAEKRGVVLVMELLNSRVDHPDYLCDHSAWGVELCRRIGSEHFGLLYDIYHMQIMEGDIIATIGRHHAYFKHYHTAGVPGRHEIGDKQELNYPAICRAIRDTGFDGYLAQEFMPAAPDPVGSLREAIRLCDV